MNSVELEKTLNPITSHVSRMRVNGEKVPIVRQSMPYGTVVCNTPIHAHVSMCPCVCVCVCVLYVYVYMRVLYVCEYFTGRRAWFVVFSLFQLT